MIMEEDFDGLATCERIHDVFPAQRIMIVSGYAPSKRGKAAMELGATWLEKPYRTRDLVRERLDQES
jgi:hypothetical protein